MTKALLTEAELQALEARLTRVWLKTVNEELAVRWHGVQKVVLMLSDPVKYIADETVRGKANVLETETKAAKALIASAEDYMSLVVVQITVGRPDVLVVNLPVLPETPPVPPVPVAPPVEEKKKKEKKKVVDLLLE